jgi:hypothetical protein
MEKARIGWGAGYDLHFAKPASVHAYVRQAVGQSFAPFQQLYFIRSACSISAAIFPPTA